MKPLALSLSFVLGAVIGVFAQQSEAQPLPLQFDQYWLNEGLSQSTVNAVEQDDEGFLWFGTTNGLNRFDGYAFTTFFAIPFDTTSITPGIINAIHEDRNGTLWVGTSGGLNHMDRQRRAFVRYEHDPDDPHSLSDNRVRAVYEDRNGTIWVGTSGGLNRMDTPGRFTRFQHDPDVPSTLSSDEVYAVFEDRNGTLWVWTTGGLNRMDRQAGTFTSYLDAFGRPGEGIGQDLIYHVIEDAAEAGVLWIASSDGLLRFETATNTYRRYLEGTDVRDVIPDPTDAGVLWLATWGEGLVRLEPRNERVSYYRRDENDPKGLKDNLLFTLFSDRTGSIWVATLSRGVHKFEPHGGAFRHLGPFTENNLEKVIHGINEDPEGIIWIGTEGGLFQLDPQTHRFTQYVHRPDDPTSLGANGITQLTRDRAGTLWVGTNGGGLNRMDAPGRFTRFLPDPSDPASLSDDWVTSIYQDRQGVFWIGTDGGLNRMDAPGRFTHFQHDPSDPASLKGDRVLAIFEDRQGVLWVGTREGGLNRMDRETGRFTHFQHDPPDPTSLSHNGIFTIHEDASGRLWIGTSNGLNRMDRDTGTFTHYTTQDSGLPANVVYVIQEDQAGHLWLSTSGGLARFDPATGAIRTFGVEDGIPFLEFSAWAGFKSQRTGELFFGGVAGAISFAPDWFEPNLTPPQVALTRFSLFNQEVVPGGGSPLRQAIWEADEIRLRHDQHSFSLEFVGLHYKNPRNNRYRYRMEPYEAEWVEADSRRMASYTNLDPGAYLFRVTASNSDGVWDEEGTSIRVVIMPPWWRTTWAYALYGLLFIAGVFAVDRVQRQRLIARERHRAEVEHERLRAEAAERELEQAREIEKAHVALQRSHEQLKATQAQLVQAEKLASLGKLTAGIAHEIKNPLNFVNNFAHLTADLVEEIVEALSSGRGRQVEDLEADLSDTLDDLVHNAKAINHHGQRVDRIVRLMMDHARGITGKRQATHINALVDEYVKLACLNKQEQVADFNVTIEQDLDDKMESVEVVPQEIGRVLLNLVTNALDAVCERRRDAIAGGRGDGTHEAADTHTGVQPNAPLSYQPTVTITTRQIDAGVAIRISDNGPGIPKHLREKIFEPFFTTKPTGSGMGLGLSLAYDIVTQGHGGTLTMESTEGEGATFIVTLPRS